MNKIILLLVCHSIFQSCDYDTAENKQQTPVNVNANNVYFYTTDYKTGASIYSFNIQNNKLSTVVTKSGNPDFKLFKNENDLLVFSRPRDNLTSLPSTLTKYTANNEKFEAKDIGNLPENVYNISHLNDSNYLVAGYENAKLAQIKKDLSSLTVSTYELKGLDSTKTEDKKFTWLAKINSTFAVLTGGQNIKFEDTQARILYLSSPDLLSYLSPKSYDIAGCKNVAGKMGTDGIIPLSSNKAVITCNPHYTDYPNTEPKIILITITEDNPEINVIKTTTSSATIDAYQVTGITRDNKYIFIEEQLNSITTKRYWLNIIDKTEIPVTNYGGSFISTTNSNEYIFNCVVENNACKAKTFGVITLATVPTGNEIITNKEVKYEYDFQNFANLMY